MDVTQTAITARANTCSPTRRPGEGLADFYTPPEVARLLTDWAIQDARSLALDPSYGGCAFLNAAYETLKYLGSRTAEKQIFGIDVDPAAPGYLTDLFNAGAQPRQFINNDFFSLELGEFGTRQFDAVIGNPPYIRYHDIPEELRTRATARLAKFGISISGRSSYWAYFLLYSMQLLRRGGRLAMVLPGALIHTDYSVQVRELLVHQFKKVTIHLLQERIFDGTQEESVIVCAEGAGQANTGVYVRHSTTVRNLASALRNQAGGATPIGDGDCDGGWLRALLDRDTSCVYEEVANKQEVIRLGDWADTRIGVVTGNNDYFILSQEERTRRALNENFFMPVIKRASYVNGISATNRGLRQIERSGKDYLLLTPPAEPRRMPTTLRKYIEEGENARVHLAFKCKSREPWYIVPHTYVPEAFITCMSASWPRIIVNRSGYTCTNNIIRLSLVDNRRKVDWLRLALGTLSSFSQLSAELVGRSYGGGVLKLEPAELKRLRVPLVPSTITKVLAKRVNFLLRQGKHAEATSAVDDALVEAGCGLSVEKIALVRTARDKLFMRRRQHRKDARVILDSGRLS